MAEFPKFKVVLLGEGRAGKTSIVMRYTRGEYVDGRPPTDQASFVDKLVRVGESGAHLCIWDTAGQECYHALAPIYYRGASGAIIVYDITDAESFNRVRLWVKELRTSTDSKNIVIAIAGNKIDLEKSRSVSEAEAIRFHCP